jgi:acyl-CoA dehydrogenase
MLLLNPRHCDRFYPDERPRPIMHRTIAWFEARGLKKIKQDDCDRTWYAEFLEFQKRERLFATPWT